MFKDPIVEEVRAIKRARAERCGFDMRRMFDELKTKEADVADRLVSYPAKRVDKKAVQ